MNILIFGITGFLGSNLAEYLSDHGYNIKGTTRSMKRAESESLLLYWSAESVDSNLLAALEWSDIAINLIGTSIFQRWTPKAKHKIKNSRVSTTRYIVNAIKQIDNPPQQFIAGSAVGYYGSDLSGNIMTEKSNSGNNFLAKVCKELESESMKLLQEENVSEVRIRTGIVFDKADGAYPLLSLPFKIFVGGPVLPGDQYISWISLTDWLKAVKFIIENEISGPVNLTAPSPVTQNQFAKITAEKLNRPNLMKIPGFLPKLLFGNELVENIITNGQRVKPKKLSSLGFEFEVDDLEKF